MSQTRVSLPELRARLRTVPGTPVTLFHVELDALLALVGELAGALKKAEQWTRCGGFMNYSMRMEAADELKAALARYEVATAP